MGEIIKMNKKIFLMFILGIMLLSLISADSTLDNSIDFQEVGNYGQYIIKDLFGLGNVIQIVRLDLNDGEGCGRYCSAEFEIQNLKDDMPLISGERFLTIEEDGIITEQSIRSSRYFIKTGEEEYSVDDYEYVCTNIEDSPVQTCSNVKVGTHIESKYVWDEYKIGTPMPKGKYIVKKEGEKRPDRTVDWQIGFGNNLIGMDRWSEEWAIWGSSGESMVLDDFNIAGYMNNSIWVNGTSVSVASGLLQITKNGDVFTNRTYFDLFEQYGYGNYTIDINHAYADGNAAGAAQTDIYITDGSNSIRMYQCYGPAASAAVDCGAHKVYFYRNDTTLFYKVDSGSYSSGSLVGWGNTSLRFWVGGSSTAGMYLHINQVNYTSTSSTITLNSPDDLYISPTSEVSFNATATVSGGATLVNISLWDNSTGIWKLNQTESITGTSCYQEFVNVSTACGGLDTGVTYPHTGTGYSAWDSAIYDGDWDTSDTATGTFEMQYFNHTKPSLASGATIQVKIGTDATTNLSLNPSCWDPASSKVVIFVQSPSSGNSVNIYCRDGITSNNYLMHSVAGTRTFYEEAIIWDIGVSTTTTTFSNTLPEGSTLWGVEACDSDGDCGFSENRTVSYNPIHITPVSPADETVVDSLTAFKCNMTPIDTLVSARFLTNNGTGWVDTSSMSLGGDGLFVANYNPPKTMNWSCLATDTNGYNYTIEGDNWSVTVLELPEITIYSPVGPYTSTNITLNISVTDTDLDSCWYNLNEGINTSVDCVTSTYFIAEEGYNNLIVYANDSTGYYSTGNVTFYVDSEEPNITIYSPENDTWYNTTSILINYTITDLNLSSNWTSMLNYCYQESANVSNQSGNDGDCGLNYTGSYNTNFNSSTYDGDETTYSQFSSANHYFNVTYIKPENAFGAIWTIREDYWFGGGAVSNFTVPDDCFNQDNLTMYWRDNGVYPGAGMRKEMGCYNGTTNHTLYYDLPIQTYVIYEEAMIWLVDGSILEGENTFTVYANDTLGNFNTLSSLFYVDTIYPTIQLNTPQSGYYNSTQVSLNVTVSDTNLNTCWYNINSGGNTQYTCNVVTNIVGVEGQNNLIVYVNDSVNHINSTSVTFYIDSQSPNITLISPENDTYLNYSTVNFTANISDKVPSNYCYQESANTSNQKGTDGSCNLTYGGVYSTGSYSNEYRAYDGDWSTYGSILSGSSTMYINYTVPNQTYSLDTSLWVVKDLDTVNVSLSGCEELDGKLLLRVISSYTPGTTSWSCWSGSVYTQIHLGYESRFYEEGIYWDIPYGLKNTTVYVYNDTGLVNQSTTTLDGLLSYLIGIPIYLLDGVYTWFYDTFDLSGNLFTSEVRTLTIDTINPNITLLTPTNGSLISTNPIEFTYSVVEANPNYSTLWINDVEIETVNGVDPFSDINLSEGDYNWTVSVMDLAGWESVAEHNYFSWDNSTPNISIVTTSPIPFGREGYNITIEYNVTDSHKDTCWYEYSGVNYTISCNSHANVTLTNDTLLVIYANDSFGYLAYEEFEWNYTTWENGITYTTPVLSGDNVIISSNLTSSTLPSWITLTYNGSSYTPQVTTDGTNYIIVGNMTAPIVSEDTNVSFYYTYNINSVSYYSATYSQTVEHLEVGTNCSSGNFLIMNVSNYDEETLTKINGTVEYEITISNNDLDIVTLSGNSTGTGLLCSNQNLTESPVSLSVQLRYYGGNYLYETYNIQEAPTSSLPLNIDLFFLNNTAGAIFKINYKDYNYITYPGAIIQVQRQYLEEGIYRTVEVPIVSATSLATASFNTDNVKYKLIVINEGEVLDIFENVVPVCQNIVLGTCEINLKGTHNATTTTVDDFTYTMDKEDNEITITYVIPSGTPRAITLQTTQNSRFLTNISSCSNTIFGSGGTITCGYNDTVGDSIIDIVIEREGLDSLYGEVGVSEDLSSFYMLNNYVIGFILILTLGLMFISSGVMLVIISAVGVIFLSLIFLIKGVTLGLVSTSLAWLVIAVTIAVYKIAQKEERT